jgi:hypothetical protein
MSNAKLVFSNLDRVDALKLKHREPAALIEEPAERSGLEQYEPGTVLVIIALSGIAAVAAWLLKDRKLKTIKEEVELIQPDGSRFRRRIEYTVDESLASEASEAALTRYLTNLFSTQ